MTRINSRPQSSNVPICFRLYTQENNQMNDELLKLYQQHRNKLKRLAVHNDTGVSYKPTAETQSVAIRTQLKRRIESGLTGRLKDRCGK